MTDQATNPPVDELDKDQLIANLKLRIAEDERRMFWAQSKVAKLEAELALSEAKRAELERRQVLLSPALSKFRKMYDRARKELEADLDAASDFGA